MRPWFYKIAPLLIWLLLMVMPIFSGPGNMPATMRHHFLLHMFFTNVMILALFYSHTYIAYPLLNKSGGEWRYFPVLALLLMIYIVIFRLLDLQFPPPDHFLNGPDDMPARPFTNGRWLDFLPLMSMLITILCSFCYRVIIEHAERKALIKEQEMVHLRTELNFLRSQISPHFLFNVLNSMVALVRKRSDQLEPVIIQLSQLMRYMLYEADDKPVPLEKEIAYLKNYIQLQSLRFGQNINVKVRFPELDNSFYTLAPMLLIPFVENAFKHGTSMVDKPIIMIDMDLKPEDHEISFRVVNEINPLESSKDEQSGIGLANVKRRLELLYPGKHKLFISKTEHAFVAELKLW